jgi:2-hydroxy-6-oxonona-2,4-dienedioate hydrolase
VTIATTSSRSDFAQLQNGHEALRIYFTDSDPANEAAPIVATLHGSGPGSSGVSSFLSNRQSLLEQGFRVITLDLPGWGRSDPVLCKQDRSALNAAALNVVLDAAGISKPVHVLGASMGAHSAIAFALERPGRVEKLVLVAGGTGGRSSFQPNLPDGVLSMLDFYADPNIAKLRHFLTTVFASSSLVTEELVQAMYQAALARPDHLNHFSSSIQLYPQQFSDVSSRLYEIKQPALVVWGTEDRFVPLDIGLQIATRMARANFHVYGQTGHAPHVERALDFNRMVGRFLAD